MSQFVGDTLWSAHSRHYDSRDRYCKDSILPTSVSKLNREQRQTHSLLQIFFLVAALHPHVVRKAQEELDRIVGVERLPQLSDQDDLPYISALIKELFRWGCPAPIGIPKRVMEDDVYKGYFIPAGATIVENVW